MTHGYWNNSGTLAFPSDLTTSVVAATLNTTMETTPPVGSCISWAKSLTGTPATLPSGWCEADGRTISDADSPYNGTAIPSMNSTNRFIAGNTTSGGTGGSATHSHTFPAGHNCNSGGSTQYVRAASTTDTTTEDNLPPYYNTVWIFRYK